MTTPRMGHAPVKMNRVINGKFMCRQGDFYWDVRGNNRTLVLALPSLEERTESTKCYNHETPPDNFQYSRWSINHPNADGEQWEWDGNEEEPTITPSLHAEGYWHGYVKKGVLVEA